MGEEIYQKALEYAKKKHEGQFRIGGAPFIVHPIAVAEILRQDGKQVEYRVAAVFHDLLEDTDASEQEIVEIGGEDVLNWTCFFIVPRLRHRKKSWDKIFQNYIKSSLF